MSAHLAKYLLCYDICDPKRLRRVHRTVRDWGIPIQFSIFEVELNALQLKQLTQQLTEIIESDEDKIMLYRLTSKQKPIFLGVAVQTENLLFV